MSKFFIAILAVAVLFMLYACKANNSSSDNVEGATTMVKLGPAEFQKAFSETENAIVLDIRTPKEVAGGKIPGAQVMDFYDKDFQDQLAGLDKTVPVFVYCASGGRSGKCSKMMSKLGFSEVYDLKGGFGAWAGAGLPKE